MPDAFAPNTTLLWADGNSARAHMRMLTPEEVAKMPRRTFPLAKCGLCSRGFATARELERHLTRMHGR